jgi:hypothetical protein
MIQKIHLAITSHPVIYDDVAHVVETERNKMCAQYKLNLKILTAYM